MSASPYTVAPYLREHQFTRRSGVRHQDWRDDAACRGMDANLFFPPEKGADSVRLTREAKAVCAGCPVRTQCLQFALSSPERHGVFGGLDDRERRNMKPARTGPPLCGNGLHVMTAENTYTEPGAGPRCRACKTATRRRREQEAKYERESIAA